MEFRELRVLLAIAAHGTVVRAAKALHQSPSTVSHALASLEAKVGVQLFTRLPRGMVLTEAGKAMLGPARRALREAEAARVAAIAIEGHLAGQITIVSLRMMTVWLADLVAAFHEAHPRVFVSVLQPEREEHIPELIRGGVCDLEVMRVALVPGDLAGTPVATQTGVVIAPANHPLARRRSIGLQDLDGVAFVSPSARVDIAFNGMFEDVGIRPNVVAEADDPETIFELVRAGIGVALVPLENVGPVMNRSAVALPLTPPRRTELALVGRRDGDLGPVVDAFHDLAVERFARSPSERST
jgi:DNA-binding transcriptional LysR family regulator